MVTVVGLLEQWPPSFWEQLSEKHPHRNEQEGQRFDGPQNSQEEKMTIILVILALLLLGVIPAWPYSRNWGPYPSGGLGLILLILVVLMLLKVF